MTLCTNPHTVPCILCDHAEKRERLKSCNLGRQNKDGEEEIRLGGRPQRRTGNRENVIYGRRSEFKEEINIHWLPANSEGKATEFDRRVATGQLLAMVFGPHCASESPEAPYNIQMAGSYCQDPVALATGLGCGLGIGINGCSGDLNVQGE